MSPMEDRVQVHRFQSPFKRWVSGLTVEILVFAAFFLFLSILTSAIMWLL